MGQLAFLKMFILVAILLDVNDNRRHVHVFIKGKRHQHTGVLRECRSRQGEDQGRDHRQPAAVREDSRRAGDEHGR